MELYEVLYFSDSTPPSLDLLDLYTRTDIWKRNVQFLELLLQIWIPSFVHVAYVAPQFDLNSIVLYEPVQI